LYVDIGIVVLLAQLWIFKLVRHCTTAIDLWGADVIFGIFKAVLEAFIEVIVEFCWTIVHILGIGL